MKLKVKDGGSVAKVARDTLENKLGETIITSDNKLNYEYSNESLLEEKIKKN